MMLHLIQLYQSLCKFPMCSLAQQTLMGITYNYATPQVSDNIGVTIGPTCTPESGSTFLDWHHNVVCTATDAAGNQGTTTFSVTVINPNATSGCSYF